MVLLKQFKNYATTKPKLERPDILLAMETLCLVELRNMGPSKVASLRTFSMEVLAEKMSLFNSILTMVSKTEVTERT